MLKKQEAIVGSTTKSMLNANRTHENSLSTCSVLFMPEGAVNSLEKHISCIPVQ